MRYQGRQATILCASLGEAALICVQRECVPIGYGSLASHLFDRGSDVLAVGLARIPSPDMLFLKRHLPAPAVRQVLAVGLGCLRLQALRRYFVPSRSPFMRLEGRLFALSACIRPFPAPGCLSSRLGTILACACFRKTLLTICIGTLYTLWLLTMMQHTHAMFAP